MPKTPYQLNTTIKRYQLSKYETLDISGYGCSEFPEKITELIHLKRLILNNNRIRQIPSTLSNLLYLEELDLSHNLIENLSDFDFSPFKKIKKINLSHNQLSGISISLFQLPKLKCIELMDNDLTKLVNFTKNTSLEELYCANNRLTYLPNTIKNLISLKRLGLENNKIEKLPDGLYNLSELQILHLNKNNINNISEKILNFKKLEDFYLKQNPLEKMPDN